MRRRGRWRRRGKWVGTVAAAAIVLGWFVSRWYYVWIDHIGRGWYRSLWVSNGCLRADRWYGQPPGADGLHLGGPARIAGSWTPSWIWLPDWSIGSSAAFSVTLPLWIPFLGVAPPTAWLWRLDRRRLPGACPRCGYDLAGIRPARGVCPECGTSPEAGGDR